MRLHMRRLFKMVTWRLRAWNFQFLLILATPFDKSGLTHKCLIFAGMHICFGRKVTKQYDRNLISIMCSWKAET